MDITQGDHVANSDWDPIPAGQPGSSQENPILTAPADWSTNGVPYGAWCKCCKCNLVFRSTIAFDCHAGKPGDLLTCEDCSMESAINDLSRNLLPLD
jgi:hypothetical protein